MKEGEGKAVRKSDEITGTPSDNGGGDTKGKQAGTGEYLKVETN